MTMTMNKKRLVSMIACAVLVLSLGIGLAVAATTFTNILESDENGTRYSYDGGKVWTAEAPEILAGYEATAPIEIIFDGEKFTDADGKDIGAHYEFDGGFLDITVE